MRNTLRLQWSAALVAAIVTALAAISPASTPTLAGDGCAGADHDCCHPGMAGCSDPACCELICAFVDGFCCSVEWDRNCVFEAASECAGGAGYCSPCEASNHNCCKTGSPGCTDPACCAQVCDIDPFCCTDWWDWACAEAANAVCDADGDYCVDLFCGTSTHGCCVAGPAGCDDPNCCTMVCQLDVFCCTKSWDLVCVSEADTICGGGAHYCPPAPPCGAAGHDPCTVGGPGSNDAACCNDVCQIDPTCCETGWDQHCVALAVAFCGQACSFATCPNPAVNCYASSSQPGCNDPACCSAVCEVDPFCCSDHWDNNCVMRAMQMCTPPPITNDACSGAVPLPSNNPAKLFHTRGATTDGPSHPTACHGSSCDNDVWFSFTAPQTKLYVVTLCDSLYDTVLAVYEGCSCPPTESQLLACNDDYCGLQSQVALDAQAGHCYLIRIGGHDGATGAGYLSVHSVSGWCDGDFPCDDPDGEGYGCDDPLCCNYLCNYLDPWCCEVTWDEICAYEGAVVCANGTCDISCPPGAIDENEPCGTHINDGCLQIPAAAMPIQCGDVVCGQLVGADSPPHSGLDAFDSDWYQFDVPEDGTLVSWTVKVAVPVDARLLKTDGCRSFENIAFGQPGCPTGMVAAARLASGRYVALVQSARMASSFDIPECFSPWSHYVAGLDCSPPCLADIAPAGTGDETVDIDDLFTVINAWGPCPEPANCAADISPYGGDHVVDIDDLFAVINSWGDCP